MNIRSWIVIIMFLIWGALCWEWYTCVIKGFCTLRNSDITDTTENYDPPFTFSKSSFVCIKGKGLQNYIDSLRKLIDLDQTIIITGLYDTSEINKSTFNDLGIARANRIKNLLGSDMDTSKIRISSRLFDTGTPSEPFIAHETTIVINEITEVSEEPVEETTESAENRVQTKIDTKPKEVAREQSEKNVIYFKQNSSRMQPSAETDNYLTDLASQLKANGKKIYIIGHTDNTEKEKLGRIRAWVVKSELLERGVRSEQLITGSKGSKEPLADNRVPEERVKNRRVVISN